MTARAKFKPGRAADMKLCELIRASLVKTCVWLVVKIAEPSISGFAFDVTITLVAEKL